jgi:hypothetical protein
MKKKEYAPGSIINYRLGVDDQDLADFLNAHQDTKKFVSTVMRAGLKYVMSVYPNLDNPTVGGSGSTGSATLADIPPEKYDQLVRDLSARLLPMLNAQLSVRTDYGQEVSSETKISTAADEISATVQPDAVKQALLELADY